MTKDPIWVDVEPIIEKLNTVNFHSYAQPEKLIIVKAPAIYEHVDSGREDGKLCEVYVATRLVIGDIAQDLMLEIQHDLTLLKLKWPEATGLRVAIWSAEDVTHNYQAASKFQPGKQFYHVRYSKLVLGTHKDHVVLDKSHANPL